ncbi:hypothetical protein D3C80_1684940 [compost metagenome]
MRGSDEQGHDRGPQGDANEPHTAVQRGNGSALLLLNSFCDQCVCTRQNDSYASTADNQTGNHEINIIEHTDTE